MTREEAMDLACDLQDDEVLVTRDPEVKGGWVLTSLDTGEMYTKHHDDEGEEGTDEG